MHVAMHVGFAMCQGSGAWASWPVAAATAGGWPACIRSPRRPHDVMYVHSVLQGVHRSIGPAAGYAVAAAQHSRGSRFLLTPSASVVGEHVKCPSVMVVGARCCS